MNMPSRQLTFRFVGTWAQFRPVFKAMRGINGSFWKGDKP